MILCGRKGCDIMSYADYEFYKNSYMGNSIKSEEEFLSLESKARAYIDMITSDKIDEVDDRIKSAVCGVCDVLVNFPDDNIVSESNDGYSVSYAKSADGSDRAKKSILYNTARMYLPLSLLYRGI